MLNDGTWKPVGGRAAWTLRLLAVCVVIDLLAVGSGLLELSLLAQGGSGIDADEATANDSRQTLVGALQFLALLVTAVMFIRWLRRITANLPALGPGTPRFGTGWATGGWFVPFLNLWRPFQVVKQAWQWSEPGPGPASDERSVADRPVPALLGVWWAAWLLTNFVGQAAFRLSLDAEQIDEIVTASRVTLAADMSAVVAGILAILVVRALTRRHEQAAERRDPAANPQERAVHGAAAPAP